MSLVKAAAFNDTTESGNAVLYGVASAKNSMGFRNRLINGGMAIDQRNSGASTAVADDVFCFDRWYVLTQTASVNVSRQSNQEDGLPFNIRLTQNQSSAQRMGLAQIIEGVNCRDLRGGSVVLNLRMRASASQAIRYTILEWTGTEDSVTSDVVNSWTNTTYTAGQFFISTTTTVVAVGSITPSANTWTSLSTPLTGTISSSLNNLIVFVWTEGTAAQNFTLDLSNVQLEAGTVATAFERRPYGTELALCQRYYWRNTAGAVYTTFGIGTVETATQFPVYIKLPVTMRAVPTANFSTCRGTDGSNSTAVSSFGTNYSSTDTLNPYVTCTGASFTGGRAVQLQANNSTSAWIDASAEL